MNTLDQYRRPSLPKDGSAVFLKAGKAGVLAATGVLVILTAVADRSVGNTFSLGVLYILPMMLGALVLRPGEIAGLAATCAFLRFCFDVPSSHLEASLRLVFASLAYFTSGLFVFVLVRNRELTVEHLGRVRKEKALRREAEQQLRALAEGSPAAILTIDPHGVVLAANRAAEALFAIPEGQTLEGRVIASYVPLLSDALSIGGASEGFRTAAQCYGRKEDGEIFLAHTWFSTYAGPKGTHLAAIVVDSSDEMRDREEQNLRQLMRYNRIAAGAVSHDVRNLCGAISLLCSTLSEKVSLAEDENFQGLNRLVKGLEQIAQRDLHTQSQEAIEEVPLRAVLDNLRIVIEPGWREENRTIRWRAAEDLPRVIADPQGLLQTFLNLAQNSHRALREARVRELTISAAVSGQRVEVRFADTGPGVSDPERLFQPFQHGAEGSGLGLYISRAIVRGYGGDLRFEPRERGACFVVELQSAERAAK